MEGLIACLLHGAVERGPEQHNPPVCFHASRTQDRVSKEENSMLANGTARAGARLRPSPAAPAPLTSSWHACSIATVLDLPVCAASCSGRQHADQPQSSHPASKARPRRPPVSCQSVATGIELQGSSALDELQVSKATQSIIDWTLQFAKASETYQVHSWMLLLGILKLEKCTAAQTLKTLGLSDLYGAWHEVCTGSLASALELRLQLSSSIALNMEACHA